MKAFIKHLLGSGVLIQGPRGCQVLSSLSSCIRHPASHWGDEVWWGQEGWESGLSVQQREGDFFLGRDTKGLSL